MSYKILVINPGSTSTKIAVYEDLRELFTETLRHSSEELLPFKRITDQFEFRKRIILSALDSHGVVLDSITVIVARGGLLKPVKSGVYEVNEAMLEDLKKGSGAHASNLGAIIAADIAGTIPNCKAYIADPIVVDELIPVARIAGHPLFERVSIFHALNHKAIGRKYALSLNRRYEDLNLIIAHLGGGVSVGVHRKGEVIEVNNALNGEGPFSPERSGTLPALALAELCFSGKFSLAQVSKMINGEGGMVAHLGTNSFNVIEKMVEEGNEKAILLSDAFVFNVGKAIGACAAVLKGEVDAILLTGGIANNLRLMSQIEEMVKFIAPVKVYPGEDEMFALAENGYLVLTGKAKPMIYS
jgi:butyrate kinase